MHNFIYIRSIQSERWCLFFFSSSSRFHNLYTLRSYIMDVWYNWKKNLLRIKLCKKHSLWRWRFSFPLCSVVVPLLFDPCCELCYDLVGAIVWVVSCTWDYGDEVRGDLIYDLVYVKWMLSYLTAVLLYDDRIFVQEMNRIEAISTDLESAIRRLIREINDSTMILIF